MNQFSATLIHGCFLFRLNPRFEDERGVFVKPLHLDFLEQHGVNFECRESFISYSKANVLRGMHFQLPPHDHAKVVSCVDGEIFDAVVDLRPSSPTYRKALSFRLKGESGEALYIPSGCAHGFQVLSPEGAWVAYYTSREHHAASDQGILWSSVPVEWPIDHPIVSARDQEFPKLGESEFFE
jgi:dTDP-4-dehydrorhamnose 3,5-epimerase